MSNRKFYKKADPAANLLAILGGISGYGLSSLNKHEKKHRWRNALIGATALPGAYLLLGRKSKLADAYNKYILDFRDTLRWARKQGYSPLEALKKAHESAASLATSDRFTTIPEHRPGEIGAGLGLLGTSGLLGMYGMGTHMIDVWRDKYGPAPEGVDEIAYYDFLEKQEEAKRLKDLEKSRADGIKALLANKPKDVSPSAYKEFLNAQYNV